MKNYHLPVFADIKPLPIILIVMAVVFFLAALGIVIYLIVDNKKSKKPLDGSAWLLALGNKENIKEVTANGSRLSVVLVNKEIIDREKLKELGVSSVLTMSNKITLVIEGKAGKIASTIKKGL